MPPGTWVHINVNENMVSCNVSKFIMLDLYLLGVVVRDPILASISFSDFRNNDMQPFKKRMLVLVDVNIVANNQMLFMFV
ncbi:hypothetical protein KFK09_025375 [Dendrobium nobile]|uniref:Uncharacterized protein n=1 Tax=Dendrobium nobile TaxID=94219 RepID=A0A8T3ALW7_DENNO|nr:hypothetical protein KFK09_025375 [Dendrobium nobile]